MGYLERQTLTILARGWQMGLVGSVDFIIGGRFRDHFLGTRRSTEQARIRDTGAKVALQWECKLRVVWCGGSRLSRGGNKARLGTNF